MSDKARFQVTVTTLSPLHIGSGEQLREGFDFIEHEGYLWVADQGALMRAILDEAAREREDLITAAEAISGMTLYQLQEAGWLRDEHFDLERGLFRYRLQGRTSTTGKQGELHEQIKDVYGRPYLPGSSLKGALRTVLAVGGATVRKLRFDRLGHSRRWAAQSVERELFGRNPNYDLLRALQVSDSGPVGLNQLSLGRVNIYPTVGQRTQYGRQRGLDVDVEALRQGTTFQVPIKIEGYLFGDQAERELRFGKRKSWLLNLPQWGRTVAGQRIADEIEFFQQRADGHVVLGFYSRLLQTWEGLGENELLLQVGWGTGWLSKTFGKLLQEDAQAFERLVKDYRMTIERGRKAGDPFPRSRHLVRVGEHPAVPLGWMKVTFQEK